jgi:hypothetical protein
MMAKLPAKSGGDSSKKLATTLATAVAVFAVRKLLTFGWQRVTGKTPPDPADPKVRIVEALGWAALVGVTVEATKLFAARATTRRARAGDDPGDA